MQIEWRVNVLAAQHNEVCGQPRTHLDVYTLLSMTILQHNHVHCGRGCHVRTRRNDGSDGSNDVYTDAPLHNGLTGETKAEKMRYLPAE